MCEQTTNKKNMIKKSSLCDVAKQRPEKQKSKQKLLLIKKFNEINKHASKFVGTLSFEKKRYKHFVGTF